MEIGQREIPDLGPRRLDVELATEARNRRHESETETEPETVATDGGAVVEPNDGRPTDCDCSPASDDDGLGCWPCYRDGHKTANPAVEDDENDEMPARSEPADFGGGESTGVIDL